MVVLGAIFAVLAVAVQSGATSGFDNGVLQGLRNPADPSNPSGPAWLIEAARDFTALGSYAVLGPLVALVVCYLWLMARRFEAVYVAATILSGLLVSNTLKYLFNRQRPAFDNSPDVFSASFPSGHATMSAVVFLTLAVVLISHERRGGLRIFAVAAAICVVLLVGLSRIYLGVHFPTDVAAGWSLGAAWATLAMLIRRGFLARRAG